MMKLKNRLECAAVGRVLLAPLCVLAIAGCSSGTESQPQEQEEQLAEASVNNTGVLETSGGDYNFTPTLCAFYKENGVDDIEIGGPGVAPDGEKFFFELTSTGNEISLDLGVDGPFQSSDRKLIAGQHVTEAFEINVADKSLTVPRLVLADSDGERVDENASLRIDCNG